MALFDNGLQVKLLLQQRQKLANPLLAFIGNRLEGAFVKQKFFMLGANTPC